MELPLDKSVMESWVHPTPQRKTDDSWSGLGVLESEKLRFVPFDNGQVSYSVDKLGDGQGFWEFREEALHVFAQRPRFDMHWVVSQSKDGGYVVRYWDRHGLQSERIQFMPASQERKLRAFSSSALNL